MFWCKKGYFKNATQCAPCAIGHYTDFDGLEVCESCNVGYYQPAEGSAECLACPPGTFASSKGTVTCLPCPAGKYAPNAASWECIDCPLGTKCPTNSTSPIECPPSFYCPDSAPEFVPCPDDHTCPERGMMVPSPCTVCESTPSGSAREAKVNCSGADEGRCVGIKITAPTCDWYACFEAFAGGTLATKIQTTTPLCFKGGLCGVMKVSLWRGKELLGVATGDVAPGTMQWETTIDIARDTQSGSNNHVCVNYVVNGSAEHQEGHSCSNTFIVRDYFDASSRAYATASDWSSYDKPALEAMCNQGALDSSTEDSTEKTRMVTRQFANLACRCLTKHQETGRGCDGTSAEFAPLRPGDYAKDAKLLGDSIIVLKDQRQFQLIQTGFSCLAKMVSEGIQTLGMELAVFFEQLSVSNINSGLKRREEEIATQTALMEKERDSTVKHLFEVGAQHRELALFESRGMERLEFLSGNFIEDSTALVEKKTKELTYAVKKCKKDEDRKGLLETVFGGIKIVAGVALMFVPGSQTFGAMLMMQGGLVGGKGNEKLTEFVDKLATDTKRTKQEDGPGFADGCLSNKDFLAGLGACSERVVDKIRDSWNGMKAGDFDIEVDAKMAASIGRFVDEAASVVSLMLKDSGQCGKVQAIQSQVAEAQLLLGLLHGFSVGLLNLKVSLPPPPPVTTESVSSLPHS